MDHFKISSELGKTSLHQITGVRCPICLALNMIAIVTTNTKYLSHMNHNTNPPINHTQIDGTCSQLPWFLQNNLGK